MLLKYLFKNKKVYSSADDSSALLRHCFLFFMVIAMDAILLVPLLFSDSESAILVPLLIISQVIMLVCLFFIIKSLLFTIYTKRLFRKRSYLTASRLKSQSKLSQSVVFHEFANAEIKKIKVMKEGGFWQLYDAIFVIYKKEKRIRKETTNRPYYTIFEAKFNRITPHVVLDSVTAKKKQFRHLYLGSQKTALGAGFDQHFETYVPQHYDLDALSFITPEVMAKMLDIKDCDIEFLQGNMLCYAPFLNEEQLAAFLKGCLALHETINHNLSSYQDSWLKEGEEVTEFGKQLLKSPRRALWIALSAGAILMISMLLNTENVSFHQFLSLQQINLLLIPIIGYNIFSYIKITLQNKHKEADFRKRVLDYKDTESQADVKV